MSQPRRKTGGLGRLWLAGAALSAALSAPAAADRSGLPIVGAVELFARQQLSGVALHGFDPVSYFLLEGPKSGRPEHELIWGGVAWRFASAANRQAFADNPEAYAPRFGGLDATAAARGLIVEASPWLYVVRSERLYLFRSDHARARFLADESLAEAAEERWPALQRELVHP